MGAGAGADGRPASFYELIRTSEKPVLVDFWAPWCGPCKMIAPIVDEIADEYAGRLKVAKLDIDTNAATPQQYGIRGIPTLMIFKDGKVVDRFVGVHSKADLQRALDRAVA